MSTLAMLDYWTTRRLLGDVLDAVGREYVYQQDEGGRVSSLAHYRHADEPGCLVAWVLVASGWTLDELDLVEDTTPTAVDVTRLSGRAGALWSQRTTPAARRLLDEIQRRQDAGLCWGDCVDQALAVAPAPLVVVTT